MNKIQKQSVIVIVFTFIILILLSLVFYIDSLNFHKKILPNQIHHASSVLFYKDDCKECRSLIRQSYFKLLKKGTLLVNMNVPENKRYREEYAVVFVPTMYVEDKEFIGLKDIQKSLSH